MSSPKVSVIMPTHNGMPYLKEAVESILKQTYKNFELIIVNDNSKDNTQEYLKSIKDKRIVLIKNSKNLGVAKSLNKGINKSTGDYIARMDADDISNHTRLKNQLTFLKNNPSIDICGTWVDLINEKGRKIGEKNFPLSNEQIKKTLIWYSPVIHPTLMTKKEIYKKLKGYNPKFDMAEDYDFLIRASNMGFKIANINEKLLKLRLHNQRRSRSHIKEMAKIDLKIKVESMKKGYFSKFYLPLIAVKFFNIYFIPTALKIKLAKILNLA